MSLENPKECEHNFFAEGELYEVSGIHIEPVALYLGAGVFRGIYIESRQSLNNRSDEILSVRIGEEHSKLFRPSKTLIVHGKHPEEISPREIETPPVFTNKLIRLVSDYYRNLTTEQMDDRYLDKDSLEFKIGQLAMINSLIEKDEVVINQVGSVAIKT